MKSKQENFFPDIYYDEIASKQFNPQDPDTLRLESKLIHHGLTKAKPVGYTGLPSGTVSFQMDNSHKHALVRSEDQNERIIVYGSATPGSEMDRLIRKLAKNK